MSSNLNSRPKGKDSNESSTTSPSDSTPKSSSQASGEGGGEKEKQQQQQKVKVKNQDAANPNNLNVKNGLSGGNRKNSDSSVQNQQSSNKSVSKEKEKEKAVDGSGGGPRPSSSNPKQSRASLGQGGNSSGGNGNGRKGSNSSSRNVSSGSTNSNKNDDNSSKSSNSNKNQSSSSTTTISSSQKDSNSNQNQNQGSSNSNRKSSSSRTWSTSSSNASISIAPTTTTTSSSSNAPALPTGNSSTSQDSNPTTPTVSSSSTNHKNTQYQQTTNASAPTSSYVPSLIPQGGPTPQQSLDLPFSGYQSSTIRSPSLPPLPTSASPVHFNPVTPSSYGSISSSSAGLSPALIAALATSATSPAGAAEAVADAVAVQQAMAGLGEPVYPYYYGAQGVGGHSNQAIGIAGRAASLPGGGSVGGGSPSSNNGGGSNNRGRAHTGYHNNMMTGSYEGVAQNLNLNPGYNSHPTSHRSPQMRASFAGNGGGGNHQSSSSSNYHNYPSGNSSSNHSHSHASNSNGNGNGHHQNSHSYVPHHPPQFSGTHYHPPNYERYTSELTSCIIAFLSPILPTEEEYRIKEATRRQLERLAGKVSPGAKLLAFGSMANGFALRNSDMDLCCLLSKTPVNNNGKGKEKANENEKDQDSSSSSTPPSTSLPAPETRAASELVDILGQVIREETDFNVMPLPKARIPIIKISRPPTNELPYEISCDIGFENRLALENTRLLLSYAMVDPPRLRTLVLFLKVWTKRRKLNSPYTGTLSSYGYTLMVLFFLAQVKKPPVLPNLQRVPPSRPLAPEEVELNGHNIYFYDDVATLRQEWSSQNAENVGELLIDFFRYFSKEFSYSKDVISIRTDSGILPKDGRQWSAELCIEDPFQLGYNVSRTVTKDGLYTIRGEFMRAVRILLSKNGRVSAALAELCEEREDIITRAPDTPARTPRYSQPSSNSYFGADTRSYRDVHDMPRRYDGGNASGLAGSFAFEEMARGLGQVQRNLMSYPPTAAMLAPLSQNNGLSPRPSARGRVRTGKPSGYYQGGRGPSQQNSNHGLPMSSTRSESGEATVVDSTFDTTNPDPQPSTGVTASSARSSPSFAPAVPQGLQHSNGVGEAFAYGSEISFGSESFRLHPHSPSVNATLGPSIGSEVGNARTTRSFSETLNRSKSLPRRGVSQSQEEITTPRRPSQNAQAYAAQDVNQDEDTDRNGSSTTNYPTFSQESSPGQTQAGYGSSLPSHSTYGSYPQQQYPYPEYYPGQRIVPTQSGRQSPTSIASYDLQQQQQQQLYQQYPPPYPYQAWGAMPYATYGNAQMGASAGYGPGGAASVSSLPNGSIYGGQPGVQDGSSVNLDSDQEPFHLDDDEGEDDDAFSSPSEGTLDELARVSNLQEEQRSPPSTDSPFLNETKPSLPKSTSSIEKRPSEPNSHDQRKDEKSQVKEKHDDDDKVGEDEDEHDQTISQIDLSSQSKQREDHISTPIATETDPKPKSGSHQERSSGSEAQDSKEGSKENQEAR